LIINFSIELNLIVLSHLTKETTFRANSRINPSTQKMDAWKVNTVKSFNKQLDNFVSKIRSYLTIQTELLKRKIIHTE